MKRYDKKYGLLALTALLLLLWQKSGYSAEAPEVVLIRVPPGWTAENEGYFLNQEALAELTAATKTYRLERDAWEKAYYELSDRAESHGRSLEAQVAALKREMAAEDAAWQKKVRAASRRVRSPGFGFFAGAGIVPGGFEPVVGAGIVWRLW